MALHHASDSDRHGESISNPVQIMILSLFFQLLVFFILMNSISVFTPKADKVIKSMKDSMGGVHQAEMLQGTSLFPLSGRQYGEGTSLDTLGGAFEHEVPGLTAEHIRDAGLLEMDFAGSALNKMLGVTPQGAGGVDPRLKELIKFVKTHEKPRYKIMFLTHIRPALFGALSSPDKKIDTSFLTFWAGKWRAAGVPPDRFEYGIIPGHPGSVTVRVVPLDTAEGENGKGTPSFVPPVSAPARVGTGG